MSASAPIGVFDSGVGGLTVAREIRRLLPAETLLYFADTAFCPYGDRPIEQIRSRSLAVGEYLVRNGGAKAIVVACNTASGAALEAMRRELPVPVIGMEPAVKPAARATRNGRVGVIATAATLAADRFDRLMAAHAGEVEVSARACPELVELVEEGGTGGPEVTARVKQILAPFREAGVDTLVLGCTHYPFLRETIAEAVGPGVVLIDSGEAVARQTGRVLRDRGLSASLDTGGFRALTTGDLARFAAMVERLWGEPVDVAQVEIAIPTPSGATPEARVGDPLPVRGR